MGQRRRYKRYKSKYNYNPGRSITLPKFLAVVALLAAIGIVIAVLAGRHGKPERPVEEYSDTLAVEQPVMEEQPAVVETAVEEPAADTTAVAEKPKKHRRMKKADPVQDTVAVVEAAEDTTAVGEKPKKHRRMKKADPVQDTVAVVEAEEDATAVAEPVKVKKERQKPAKEQKQKKSRKQRKEADRQVDNSTSPLLNMTLSNEMSSIPELDRMDREIERFTRYWNFTGVTLAVTDNDRLVYCKGYGMKDEHLPMTPGTLMRIASVSKLITATAIMRLVEDGSLSLESKVFGDDGILNDTTFTNVIKDKRYYEITVGQLLRHESGLSNRWGDPMFCTRDIILQNKLEGAPDHNTLVKCVVRRPISFEPGTTYRYSNFGYLLLSMVIEHVTGENYEKWVQQNVLEPAGCRDMHLAGNFYHERRLNESRYYMQPNAGVVAPFDGTQDSVISCYGGADIRALAGAGGWIASAPELARFVCAIDGLDGIKDIISDKSRHTMTSPDELSHKPFGWASSDANGTLTRSGTLDGSTVMVKYYPDGQCWILIVNTDAWRGPHQSSSNAAELDRLREKYSGSLPDINLFETNGD
ncbi:MAG: serine hydrolase, partial [Bacteroidales bacterium]|nr:serine hydrolase [Candidatus Equibacterium intestinale]